MVIVCRLAAPFSLNEMAQIGVTLYVAAVFICGVFDKGEMKLCVNESVSLVFVDSQRSFLYIF